MSKDMAHSLSANQIADYFLFKGNSDSRPISNKKLQKLLYYAQAWSLVTRGEKLFNDKIEAWVHGPAIKSIYLEFKEFGASPIEKSISEREINEIPVDVQQLLDEVWTVYGSFDATYLEQLTHSETPWQKAREGIDSNLPSENEITTDSMRAYYSHVLEESRK